METMVPNRKPRFGAFEVDLRSGALHKHGIRIKIQDQPFQVLALLLERPGELVTREELRQKLWPADTFVDFDTGLNSAVKKLRDALSDSADEPRYIETFPRRGYRFIAEVKNEVAVPIQASIATDPLQELSGNSGAGETTAQIGPPAQNSASILSRTGSKYWVGAALVFLAALLLGFTLVRRQKLSGAEASTGIQSIAVLPLENLSGDPSQEYFSDGMTDALITELAQVRNLKVISRTSVMHYKGARKTLPEIARELQVDAVVEGSVVRSGDKVKITAQLIRAATDTHIWAASYSRVQQDVLGLQAEVAEQIAKQISKELTPLERTALSKGVKIAPAAYEAYLKGSFYFGKMTPDSVRAGLQFYQAAVEADPNYAAAYAEISHSYMLLSALGEMPAEEAYAHGREAAEKAVALDPNLGRARESLAAIASGYDWDWNKAEHEYVRAIELNPNSSSAHLGYTSLLLILGKPKESGDELRKAREVDPISLGMYVTLVFQLYVTREYDQALVEAKKGLELYPETPLLLSTVAAIYTQSGEQRLAVEATLEAEKSWGASPERLAALRRAYNAGGMKSLLRERILLNKKPTGQRPPDPYDIAHDYAVLDDKDQALFWLEKVYRVRDFKFPYVKRDPAFESVRADPRFLDLLKRGGIPQ
jgi:TolB-like protein/DNA-binding winged helix-turn-helix (wHTH) protein